MSGLILNLLILIAIYTLLAWSLNLALGFTGLMSLAHISFYGIGAYAMSVAVVRFDWPYYMGFLLAPLIAGCFGLFLILATRRLRGDYLALATLGFSFVIYHLIKNLDGLTEGTKGIMGIPRPPLFESTGVFLVFLLFIVALVYLFLHKLIRSPFGLLMHATRDDEIALRTMGKNIKTVAMVLSAAIAGVAGALYASYITYISPGSFHLEELIIVLTLVIVGGLASLEGSFIATATLVVLPELLRFFTIVPDNILAPLRLSVYALVLLVILMIRPRGILGKVELP